MAMTSVVYEYWHDDVLPTAAAVWYRLEIPSWNVYKPVMHECAADVWKASQSTAQLSVLTLRPIAIFFWILLEVMWEAAQVLFRVLLSQGWIQLKKGLIQLKAFAIWFYHFQMSLSRTEILGEFLLLGMILGCYYLYKWVRQQTYWQRFVRWYNTKKLRAIERTTKFFDRVARVSLILAMALPHMAFVGIYFASKCLFPSFVKWMAYDTYTTALLSIWYPLFMTLSWVHDARSIRTRDGPVSSSDENTPSHSTSRPTVLKNSRDRKGKRVSGVFSRTNPPKPETPNVRGQKQKAASPARKSMGHEPEAATRFWLRYWVVFAMAQSLGTFGAMVPVFGTFVAQHPFVLHVCSEIKLLFFIWLFTMENLIGAAVVEEDALMAKAMPLALIHEHITPLLLEFEAVVAEAVSQTTWTTLVLSKAQRLLEFIVILKMISETRKDWLLHILEEGRTLLLPSLSLFLPSFITSWGVAYVQFIVPSAKATRVLKAEKKRNISSNRDSEEMELLYLEYWIIHCLASSLLAYFSTILWWIPFSTHATFLMWCHLSFPKSIVQTYDVFEMELVAFGLLPGESNIQIHETKTAKVLQAVYSRLPSAADAGEEGGAVTESDAVCEQLQDSTSTGLDQTVHVDSQPSHVEVSIRNPGLQSEASQDSIDDENGDYTATDENDPPSEQPVVDDVTVTKKSSAKDRKASSDDEKADEDWLPGSPRMNSSSAARDTTNSVRRSTRQRGKSSRS